MKIIILGAGQVGSTLAENLAREHHDITLVDTDVNKLAAIQDRLDVRTIVGWGSYPDVLRRANCDEADMLVAVTSNDEVNMVACQVAYSLFNTPTKIARIRSLSYFTHSELYSRKDLPIDVFINPEQLVTNYIKELIDHPGALQVLDFADGKVKLVGLKPFYGGAMVGKNLTTIREHYPQARIGAIFHEDKSIPLDGSTTVEVGDEVFFIAATADIRKIMGAFRRQAEPYKRIMIAGGGHIGSRLAGALENDYQVKLIDHNREHCKVVAERLKNTIVLCGDVTDKELLVSENIENMDVFCAVTNDDEDNIMSCLQAKRLGARLVMALTTRSAYVDFLEEGSINIAISPQQTTTSSLLAYIRRGDVVNVHSLRRGAAEAIEAIAHGDSKTSKVVGRTIAKVKLPRNTVIGAIVRGDEIIIPHHDTVIESDDHVILFVAEKKHIHDVEKLFQVSATYF